MGKVGDEALSAVAAKVALLFGVPAILGLVAWILTAQLQLQLTMVAIQAQMEYKILPALEQTEAKLHSMENKIGGLR